VSMARLEFGGEIYLFGVARDVTERKAVEAVRKNLALQLLETIERELFSQLDDSVWFAVSMCATKEELQQRKAQFEKLGLENALIIDGAEVDRNFALAARSLIGVDVLPVQGINVYDILRRRKLVLTKAAVEALEARFK